MRRARYFLGMITLCFPLLLNAQKAEKKPLSYNDLASWKVINKPIISNDGKLVAYELNPQKGDGSLIIHSTTGKKADTLKRGYDARFSPESNFMVFKIKQPQDSIRVAKKKKLKKEQMPKDSVGVMVFKTGKVYKFPAIKEFAIPKENAQWVAMMVEMPKKKEEAKKEEKAEEKAKAEDKDQKSQLILLNTSTGDTISYKNITSFYYASLGSSVAFIRQTKDSLDYTEVMAFDTHKKTLKTLFKQTGTAKKVACDEKGQQYGFLFSTDTIKEKVFSLYYGTLGSGEAKAVVTRQTNGLPLGWMPSEHSDLSFSQNGKYLHFGTNLALEAEPKDSLLEEEKPQLDIWSWKDKELQPEQKLNLEKEKKRTYKAVYLIEKNQFVQLADPTVREINTIQKSNGRVALGIDPMAYKLEASWTGKNTSDYYIVEVETGAKRLILKDKALAKLSPEGNYIVWYDPSDSTYYARSTAEGTATVVNLTSLIPVSFYDEEYDMPEDPKPYGIAGWSENEKYVFLYDRYDIWRVDLEGTKVPMNATRNYGRQNKIRFRYEKLDPEEEFITTEKPVIVNAFNEGTKASGYFKADFKNYTEPKALVMEDYKFEKLAKAKNADMLLWTRENISEAANVWVSNTSFGHRLKLSEANRAGEATRRPG